VAAPSNPVEPSVSTTPFRLFVLGDLPRDGGDVELVSLSEYRQARALARTTLRTAELESIRKAILDLRGFVEAGSPVLERQFLEDLGGRLFDLVIRSQVRDLFITATAQRRDFVPFELFVESSALASWPWEYLFDPGARMFVCREFHPVSRSIFGQMFSLAIEPLRARPRLLVVIGSSDDDEIDADEEVELLRAVFDRLLTQGRFDIVAEPMSARELTTRLQKSRGEFDILHFLGHSGFDLARGEGYLRLKKAGARETTKLYANDFAQAVADSRIRLAFLNACETARAAVAEDPARSSVAAALLQRGVPAVVAHQFSVPDNGAHFFAGVFYDMLSEGLPLIDAVRAGRAAMGYAEDGRFFDWGIPVLYTRDSQAVVFPAAPGARAAAQPRHATATPKPDERDAPFDGLIGADLGELRGSDGPGDPTGFFAGFNGQDRADGADVAQRDNPVGRSKPRAMPGVATELAPGVRVDRYGQPQQQVNPYGQPSQAANPYGRPLGAAPGGAIERRVDGSGEDVEKAPPQAEGRKPLRDEIESVAQARREFQKRQVREALLKNDWSITKTSRELGLSRSHLYQLINEFELQAAGGMESPGLESISSGSTGTPMIAPLSSGAAGSSGLESISAGPATADRWDRDLQAPAVWSNTAAAEVRIEGEGHRGGEIEIRGDELIGGVQVEGEATYYDDGFEDRTRESAERTAREMVNRGSDVRRANLAAGQGAQALQPAADRLGKGTRPPLQPRSAVAELTVALVDIDARAGFLAATLEAANRAQRYYEFRLDYLPVPSGAVRLDTAISPAPQLFISALEGFAADTPRRLGADRVCFLTRNLVASRSSWDLFAAALDMHHEVFFISTADLREFAREAGRSFALAVLRLCLSTLMVSDERWRLGFHAETAGCLLDYCDNRRDMVLGLKKAAFDHAPCRSRIKDHDMLAAIDAIMVLEA
jgi:hypothetical protein